MTHDPTHRPTSRTAAAAPTLGYAEFLVMMAALSALGAIATDAMLPALPVIGTAFHVTDANRLQFVITTFLMGSGLGQLLFGPLSDAVGRRPVLLAGLALYALLSVAAALSVSLPMLIGARLLQGIAAAATTVLSRAIVRDRYSGTAMARVSSTVFVMFLAAPVLAPSIGQLLLARYPWPVIFGFLATLGGLAFVWVALRLPETLPVDRRHPFGWRPLGNAARFIASHPASLLYMVAMMLLFGGLLTYVATMPQVFSDVFKSPQRMALTFACTAGLMGFGSFINARIVERFGMHRISHGALLGLLAVSGVHGLVALAGHETVLRFTLLQGLTMMGFSLSLSNFGAIAMQPMGRVAGSAASLQGMSMGLGGALISAFAGSFWRGSVALLPLTFFSVGLLALGGVLLAERGRLFGVDHPRHATP